VVPIEPVQVEVVGVHPHEPRLLVVRVHLNRPPPSRWREMFAEAAQRGAHGRTAAIDGPSVLVTSSDADLEADVASVEEWIRLANARFLLEMRRPRPASAPMMQAVDPEVLQESFSDDIRARIRDARRRAGIMSGVYTSGGLTIDEAVDPVAAATTKGFGTAQRTARRA
jgi:hypothetical protein